MVHAGTGEGGAQGRNRTTDTVIFSHVLYQLSYLGARRVAETGLIRVIPQCVQRVARQRSVSSPAAVSPPESSP